MRAELPERSLGEVIDAFPALRQSLLASWSTCRLSALFSLQAGSVDNAAKARGVIFHRFAGEVLRTLRRTGETSMPVEEGLQILYEVAAQRDVPSEDVVTVPLEEQKVLRMAAIMFVHDQEWNMTRLVDVERRLYTAVEYPDPESGATVRRSITGQPDALVADPPTSANGYVPGAVVLDWKLWRQPPPKYTGDATGGDAADVSWLGVFQQRFYALLIFRNFPAVQRCTLREYYPLAREARTAVVHREQEEHLEREMSTLAELLDRGLREGQASPIWKPSPGRHCAFCERPIDCPIEARVRAFDGGGIATREDAEMFAEEYAVGTSVRKQLHEALKEWALINGPIRAGEDTEARFEPYSTGRGKRFGIFPAQGIIASDAKLEEAFANGR